LAHFLHSTNLSVKDRPEPIGLALVYPCLPHPDLRAFSAIWSKGAADRMNVLHLSAAVYRFERLFGSPVDSPFCLGRLVVFSQGNDVRASNAPAGKTSRLSSAFVPFSVFRLELALSEGSQPPARSRFSVCFALAVFCGHSSSQAADVFAPATVVGDFRSCAIGLILDDVPLSVPHGF
jgi:hypothetical protein